MAESPTMEVRARITADSAQFQKGLQDATRSAQTFQTAAGGLNKSILAIGVASSTAAIALINFAVKSFRAAAEVQELDIALVAIGRSSKYGSVQLAVAVDEIQDLGITAAASRRAVIKLAQSNVDLSKVSQLASVAQDLSVASTKNSADVLQMLTMSISRAQTRMLSQLGITVQAEDAYRRYGQEIGKASKDLTMGERRQAVFNAVLKEGGQVAGAYALAIQSPSRALKEFSDLANNLQVAVGTRLLNAFSAVILSSFALATRFTQATRGSGTFAKVLEAMEKVFTKLSKPIIAINEGFTKFIDKIDKSEISVDNIASAFEKALPVVAAFTTFVGVKAGKEIFQAMPIFQGLFKMMNAGVMAFVVFAATSSQVQQALAELVKALQPLLGGVKDIGATFSNVGSTAVSIFAAAIRGVANIVRTSITFFRQNEVALFALKTAVVAVTAAFVAYKVSMMAQSAVTRINGVIEAINIKLHNAKAIMLARTAVAQAQATHQTNLANIASAKQAQATATLQLAQARQQAVTSAQTVALVRQGKVVGTTLPAALAKLTASQTALTTAQTQATVATNAVATAQARAAGTAQALTVAQNQLATATKKAVAPFLIKIALLAGLVMAFIYAWKNSETFREVVVNVFNTVAQVIGTVLSFVLTALGNLMIAFGTAVAPTTSFGQTLIQVFQFIYTTALNVFIGIFKVFKFFLQVLKYASSGQTAFGKVVRAVLNFIFKAFAVVVGGILKFIGFFLEGLGMLLDTHGLVGNIIAGVLDFLFKAFATVIGGIIKFIGVFIEFLGNLLDTNALVGKLIAGVLDFLIDAFATVFGGIFKYIGMFIGFLGDLLDSNSLVGEGIAKVIDFIAEVYFTLVSKVAGFLAKIVGALENWLKGNKEALDTAIGLFNKFAEGVGKALAFIPNALADILERIGTFVKKAADKISAFFTKIADAARGNKLTAFLADDVDAMAKKFKEIGENVKDTFVNAAKPIRTFATKIADAYTTVISKDALDRAIKNVDEFQQKLLTVSKTASGLSEQKFGTKLVDFISDGLKKVGDFSTKIGSTILEVTKVPIAEALVQSISDALTGIGGFVKKAGEVVLEASDIKLGTALVQMLSDASKTIGSAVSKVGDFVYELKRFEVGDILGDFIGDVADLAIPIIDKLVNVMEGLKDVEVGKFLVENLSSLSLKAGETILGFASAVKSFTTGNVFEKTKDAFGDLAEALKKGLGFGDVLAEEKKRAEELAGINGEDDETLDELQKSADLMKKIRDAMTAGIESMRDVLTDLQDAAKQFADSLKDTIMSFAGLKGVELPDGFIPKAKSLIDNMRMRLDKSQQFANQILTLQGLGLDAQAIQDLVEAGPIKGAQLAASILGGGVDAIAQINDLQKQISFAGAAIGGFGSEAAFGEQIRNAQASLARVTDFEPRIGGLGNRQVVIEQGAFVVNVDTRGLETVEDKADLITQRIQETFAILAKELANK